MQIWSQPEDRSSARYLKESFSGQMVHFGVDPNPHAHYLGADGKPIQHDRAFVAEMPEVSKGRFSHIIKTGMRNAHYAAIQPPGYKHGQIDSDPQTQGGTTGTLALYHPHTFTLDIGSKGDSPVFLILDDGTQSCVTKLTYSGDAVGHNIFNAINFSPEEMPVREAQYPADGKMQSGTIHLDQLSKQIAEGKALDPSTLKTHILVASDGILKPDQGDVRLEEMLVNKLYMQSRTAANKAQAIAHAAMFDEAGNKKSRDNISVILIEDIQPRKGQPIAACVCDGFYKRGGDVAENAIDAIKRVVQNEIERAGVIERHAQSRAAFTPPEQEKRGL